MHFQIQRQEGIDIHIVRVGHGLGHLFQQVIFVLDLDVLFGRTDLNEIAKHRAFHGGALVYDLIHDIQIDGGDDGALAGNDLHKAVLFQPLQGSAHRCARNAEPFAQLIFADGLSGLDLQRDDLIFQRLVDVLRMQLFSHVLTLHLHS